MRSLIITSSSNILPNNLIWKNLDENNNLIFAEFGSWANTLINSKKDDNTATILFLKDFISDLKDRNLETKLDLIIDLFSKRVSTSNGIDILLISTYFEQNILDTTRLNETYSEKISSFFKKLDVLTSKHNNFIVSKLDLVFSINGYVNCLDNRNWYLARCHLSLKGIELISKTIKEILDKKLLSPKKLLILDCDNTIWGGVVGEDGIKGIKLGQDGEGIAFQDFQKQIKKISDLGTLIALSSKNNENDVFEIFEKHQSMILKKKDIVISKINWREKSENILELSSELNLGLDSMVFWDDNPIEREKVKLNIPDVTVIEPPNNVFDWPNYLASINYFSKFKVTEEDKKKKEQYQIRGEFINNKKNFSSEIDFLKKINLKPQIVEIKEDNINRASQLSLKTNQFNFRTQRYSEKDIIKMIQDENAICFMVSLSDIYGDHGNIGLISLKRKNEKIFYLDNFLLSCRILGRYLEFWILKKIIDLCKSKGAEILNIEYIKTKKNSMILEFLKELPIANGLLENNKNTIEINIDLKKIVIPKIEVFNENI